jgi:addiction module RelB/DinJ family antitoxin
MKTVMVRAMIDPKKKERVSKILSRLGINHSEAINIYYSLIEEYKGLPFNIKLPEKDSKSENISQEVIGYLKESIKKNYRLGELLAE